MAGMSRRAERRRVTRVRAGRLTTRPDTIAVEEPLEIRVGQQAVAVTMRTPGDDFELATGFLLSEGILNDREQLVGIRHCDDGRPDPTQNIVDVTLNGVTVEAHRHHTVSSSCGLCGRDSLDQVRTHARWHLEDDDARIDIELLGRLPDQLREGQAVFDRTGSLHAAGLFTADGELLVLREDVGRHNAVDKVVGWALMQGRLPARGSVLQVSSRLSFELVQKAWIAGIPIISGVSAPSTLAIDLAEEAGMGLAGFVRGDSLNLYAGVDRFDCLDR